MAPNSAGSLARPGRALVDGWYRWLLPEHRPLGDVVNRWPERLRPLVWRFGLIRALTLVIAARGHPAIVTIRRDPGWRSLLLLSALVHRSRKLVVLHFIDYPLRREGLRGVLDSLWRPIERWCVRRTLLQGHVLSPSEAGVYSQRYAIAPDRFVHVPFAWREAPAGTPATFPAAGERSGVIAAGRVSCDWRTLFAAAVGQGWALTVVCPAPDRRLVDELNTDGQATVHSDLSREQTQALLEAAAVSVIATYETGVSQGHVRLRSSVDAGAPVVASNTRSMDGYVRDGETAVLVPAEDPDALRQAVNRLLRDPSAREAMARAAWEWAERWTWADYLSAISELAGGAPPRVPQAAASAVPDATASEAASRPSRREITLEIPSDPIDTP